MSGYVAVCYWADGVNVFQNERLDALLVSLLECVHAGMEGYTFGTPLEGFQRAVAEVMIDEDYAKSYEDLAETLLEYIQPILGEGKEFPKSDHWERVEDLGRRVTRFRSKREGDEIHGLTSFRTRRDPDADPD